jgi:hypothetical protein
MATSQIKFFKLHWLTNEKEIIHGTSIADAFTKAGYGAGALRALDYYSETIPQSEIDDYKNKYPHWENN